jgi:DNA-binding transcriptional regulator YiaG
MSGDEVRKLRATLKLKQVELADLLGVSEREIRRWEKSDVLVPKIATLALWYLAGKKRKKGGR